MHEITDSSMESQRVKTDVELNFVDVDKMFPDTEIALVAMCNWKDRVVICAQFRLFQALLSR